MSSELPNLASVSSFRVKYQAGAVYNRDLAGEGELTIRDGEYVFTGNRRGVFASRKPATTVIPRDQIRGARAFHERIQFVTSIGRSGRQKAPFVFFCADPATALQILSLLPPTEDPEQNEAADFRTKLRAVALAEGGRYSITNLVIGANVLVFVIMGLLGAGWFETASMRPYILYVANNGAATTDGQWWRLVTAMFVHYGLLHLLFNMWALYQAGHLVERLLGRALFALMYFGSGLVGGLTTLVWHGDKVWSAGASGAVFGVYGALFGYLVREKHGIPRSILQPLMKSTVTFAAYNLLYGAVQAHIDNTAHIGGVVGGVVLGWLCATPLDPALRQRLIPRRFVLGSAMLVAALAVGVKAAPRYNYHVVDEYRFEEALAGYDKQEDAIIAAQKQVSKGATSPEGEARVRAWVVSAAIPFYEQWRAKLLSVPLKPGTPLAHRRDLLCAYFKLKADNFRDLATAPDPTDPALIARDRAAKAQLNAIVRELNEMK